jgi:hypothetical protein
MFMSEENKASASWLVPAVVAAVVTLITTGLTTGVSYLNDMTANGRETRRIEAENRRDVARIRADTLKAANDSNDLVVARVLLDHVLTPIDTSNDLPDFRKKVLDHIAEKAAQSPTGQTRSDLQQLAPPTSGGVDELITKFEGDERLSASNALIELARSNPTEVVGKLIAAIRAPEKNLSYRVNLYIAFTLSRIPGGWIGTKEQLADLQKLADTAPYRSDPTFKSRITDALANRKAP